MDYDHKQIEEKWLAAWEEAGLFQGVAAEELSDKEKLYLLFAFAYPSGSGLHVGHVESGTALDIMARFYRMNGKQVFFPVGWDAFGLPAENYAVKTGVHPAETTKAAIGAFQRQVRRVGISYDWETEIVTSHPEYYKWTQWLFLKLYEKGLAYKDLGKVNWCPSCVTVLANEQVVEGKCERCGELVEQKAMEQWFFKITDYKDQLIDDLEQVDWPKPTIEQQKHWIGRQKGVEVGFQIKGWKADPSVVDGDIIRCFTTRIDTIYGVTFLVVSPEYLVDLMKRGTWQPGEAVERYLEAAAHKTEEERRIGEKDKTGEDTGLVATNPVNGQEVPIYVADYVLAGYGTGAVMGVPAHDERDRAFATKFGLPIKQVISHESEVISQYGRLINGGEFDGMTSEEAMEAIPAKFGEVMKKTTTYKLRDWLISRQRYWGAPIPIVYDPEGKPHPVKEEHLPWLLPTDVDFKPTGESPLRSSKEFVERVERLYGEGWRPEFDTMDTFVDSSWYYLRYADARNREAFASSERLARWLPVDFYMIGPEHIVLHLLYSRFLTKFLRDQGLVAFDEPIMTMRHQGMILGPDGRKMSKSKGNVVDPDEVIEQFGADTLRLYEMFMGPLEADKPWNTTSVQGVYRFVKRLYRLMMTEPGEKTHPDLARKLHWALDRVTREIPLLKFNTSIAALMELVNVWTACEEGRGDGGVITVADKKLVARMMAPLVPFLAEELWQRLCDDAETSSFESVHEQVWPQVDQQLLVEEEVAVVVAVNGKPRHTLRLPQEQVAGWKDSDATVLDFVATLPQVSRWIEGKEVKRVVFVLPPGKHQAMVNLVV